MTALEAIKKFKWFGVVGAVLLLGLLYFVISNSVTNDGNKKQQVLIVYYNDTTNILSDCLVKTRQSVGATKAQTDALDKVITDAVKGRYDGNTSAKPGGGSLFSAIAEAYPDTSGLSKSFQDVMIIINGCRTDFRDSQAILQRGVTQFNQWRTGSFKVRTFGGKNYPNEDLEITVAKETVTGKAALKQMRTLVVVEDAQSGRDTGKIDNTDPFAETKN